MIEKEDFYRIKLSDDDKQDISYILTIAPNLRNKELLYKLIWSEYLIKPFNQMIKNICGNKAPRNCIYIITNTKTREVYVGKTKGLIKDRWTEHIKTSLHIGGASGSKLHNAMYNNWSDFTFNILERVPDD